jgi:hypothetical protein
MAVYIKKDRLGSGAQSPRRNPRSIMHTIESLPTYQSLKESYAQAKEEKAASLKEQYESSGEVQRWNTQMTPEERTRDAIERMVPTAKEVVTMRNGGKEATYEESRKYAEGLAYKSEK